MFGVRAVSGAVGGASELNQFFFRNVGRRGRSGAED